MVVLLIPAILLAIAIRTFLGVTNPAIRRATRSDLDTALIAGRSVYSSQILIRPDLTRRDSVLDVMRNAGV